MLQRHRDRHVAEQLDIKQCVYLLSQVTETHRAAKQAIAHEHVQAIGRRSSHLLSRHRNSHLQTSGLSKWLDVGHLRVGV